MVWIFTANEKTIFGINNLFLNIKGFYKDIYMSIKMQNVIKCLHKLYIFLGINNFQKNHYFNSKG